MTSGQISIFRLGPENGADLQVGPGLDVRRRLRHQLQDGAQAFEGGDDAGPAVPVGRRVGAQKRVGHPEKRQIPVDFSIISVSLSRFGGKCHSKNFEGDELIDFYLRRVHGGGHFENSWISSIFEVSFCQKSPAFLAQSEMRFNLSFKLWNGDGKLKQVRICKEQNDNSSRR